MEKGLSWGNLVEQMAMMGCRSGFQGRVAASNFYARKLHCMNHRFALSVKTQPKDIKSVLDDLVAMANLIKSSPPMQHIFSLQHSQQMKL